MKTENDSNTDNPPMSRLFVVYGKSITEETIREEFEQFGPIQKIWFLKDKNSGEVKGIAYVKFFKTTDAAHALENLNGKILYSEREEKPIKVFVASSRSSGISKNDRNQDRYLRLFIIVSKSATSKDIMEEFEKFGEVEFVNIIYNRKTKESKGVAYVKYKKFIGAATAFENSPQKYKAIFATPNITEEDHLKYDKSFKRPRTDEDINDNLKIKTGKIDSFEGCYNKMSDIFKNSNNNNPTTLEVISSNTLNQDQLWRLFDIIPGLDYCHIVEECGPKTQSLRVVYTNAESAQYAKKKLHGLEYPPGERLIIRYPSGSDVCDKGMIDNKPIEKDVFCSVKLQPAKPILSSEAHCAARCFIVLSSSIPVPILKDVFCTFGSLIDVYLLNNKNCGYVKYGSTKSAELAIKMLNDAEICGVKLKIMIADEPKSSNKNSKFKIH